MNFYLEVLGCPKNVADCAILKAKLKKYGHNIVDDFEESDAIIIDTCSFILEAKKEAIEEILLNVERKKTDKNFKIFVKGCLVQRYGSELAKEIPEVDGWFGVVKPEEIAKNITKSNLILKEPDPIYDFEDRVDDDHQYAYVKIADGCDRACSFCTIPLFKGSFKSRKIEDIVKEVETLVKRGKKEIILVAQDTTGYGIDLYKKQALPELLGKLNEIKGDFWIRVMYLHPDHISDRIIEAFSYPKVLKYFDIPVQHGSSKILRLMNRTKNAKQLKQLISKIRKRYSDAIIRTSIIVGFPGENDNDFDKLLEIVKEIEFDRLGAFLYSDEEEAPSFKLEDKVSEEVARERLNILMDIQSEISFKKNNRLLGKTFDVLFDDEEYGVLIGRTYMDAPEIDANVFVKGEFKKGFHKIKITEADTYDLEGVLVDE